MWSDEILGWVLVTDPSWHHMLAAWRLGADGGGLFFYLLARLWLSLLGASAAHFRLFSAAGVGAAAALTFVAVRRYTRWSVAAPVIALVWFSSDVVLWQVLQARFYGLLLAGVAAAFLLLVVAAQQPRVGWGQLLLTFTCHMLLVGTHPFGAVYSAMLVAALLVRRSLRRVALAAAAGWWILLPSLPALRSTAAVGRPHFWTTRPSWPELTAAYTCWSLPVGITLGFCVAVALALLGLASNAKRPRTESKVAHQVSPVVVGVGLLLAVPLLVWVGSQGSASLFVDRYFVPVVIPITMVLACLAERLMRTAEIRRAGWVRGAAAVAGAGLVVWAAVIAVVQYPAYARYPGPDDTGELVQRLPRGVPIVVEPVDLFHRLVLYRQGRGLHYVSVLDWKQATGPDSLRGEVTAFHEVENWRKAGYFATSIVDANAFLAQSKPFAVIDVNGLRWFEDRVAERPEFRTRLLGTVRVGDGSEPVRVWVVEPAVRPAAEESTESAR